MLNLQTIEKRMESDDGSLDVFEVFPTIQGEGPFAGEPAVFVRLAGCNLQCPGCFGTATKSRIPYLTRSVGPKIRLDKVSKGEAILTFDENFNLVETTVTGVVKRVVKEWVSLKIAGKHYDVTPEHPFFTNRGMVAAENLEPGDEVLEARPNEVISFKKVGDRNPMKDPLVALKSSENTDYQSVGQKVSRTRLSKFQSGELVPPFYTLSPERQEEVRKMQSEAKRRDKNPNWKGKQPNLLDLLEKIQNGVEDQCRRCGTTTERLLIHHADGDHDNDEKDNLIVWCHRCHNQHHERGYNFWNGNRADGKKLVNDHNGQRVESLVKVSGRMPVVNVTCAPYPTYLANGMWVHNCDTDYTSKRRIVGVEDLVSEVQGLTTWYTRQLTHSWHPTSPSRPLVVLTGGEPFRQRCGPFVGRMLRTHRVQIETNGTLYDESMKGRWHTVSVVCSPKAGRIAERLEGVISAYKYVVRAGEVDPTDGLPLSILGGARPARPHVGYSGEVYVQPMDEQDAVLNDANTRAAIESCRRFGYRLCLQLHKLIGLP